MNTFFYPAVTRTSACARERTGNFHLPRATAPCAGGHLPIAVIKLSPPGSFFWHSHAIDKRVEKDTDVLPNRLDTQLMSPYANVCFDVDIFSPTHKYIHIAFLQHLPRTTTDD